ACEVVLNELLHRIVGTPDGEQFHTELFASTASPAVAGSPYPSGFLQQALRLAGIVPRRRRCGARILRWNGATRGGAQAGEGRLDDAIAIDRQVERLPNANVVEGGARRVVHQRRREQHWIGKHVETRVPPDELRHRRRYAGDVQLSAHQTRELRGGFVHDRDDEPGDARRA